MHTVGVVQSSWVARACAGDRLWLCDCDSAVEQFPVVHFEFLNASNSAAVFSLSPAEYMVERADGRCLLGFMNTAFMDPQNGGLWILGDRFLVNRYIVYDNDRGLVGFSRS